MKYILNIIGSEMHISAHSVNQDEALIITAYVEENDHQLRRIVGEIDDEVLPDYDSWNTNLWVFDKPDNEDSFFVIEDTGGKEVAKFPVHKVKELKSPVGEKCSAMPADHGEKGVLLCFSNSRGVVCNFHIENDEVPVDSDFTYVLGKLVTPAGKGAFIDNVFFKGVELPMEYDLQDTDNIAIIYQFFHSDLIKSAKKKSN